ncbi:hypothetical protein DQP55_24385 [Mycolicibacterium sp. GF69]|uniref:hypothetical protein n=1 Tax=Mycolicibacterium sp. GF69 TaxID=2267251 RepID=UPI000DCE9D50|nr:hypothetical protein [Mycolicibacterium sp. GF69]RAV06144.1 hypothetical protein DQP55_24385 [Mycolicibacterium sp. GF69]
MAELAARIAAGWGRDQHHTALTAAITRLYRGLIAFPAAWPEHRREAFVADTADATASILTTLLDNYLDTLADTTSRSSSLGGDDVIVELGLLAQDHLAWQLTEQLPELIADHTVLDPGRGEGSMTACGPRQRAATIGVRLPRRRGRRHP